MPLSHVVFQDVTLSAGGNCVGSFNAAALDSTCTEDPTLCLKWRTAGAVGGFIKLTDADQVNVALLGESLCVLLTGADKNSMNQCPTTALTQGDYCSTTLAAGGCGDSFWFASTFAASGVALDTSGSTSGCQ